MRKGFTLVELAITLVVIGLLIGGILIAQSMLESVRITGVIGEVQQHYIEAQSFKTRYNYLPGDYPNDNSLGYYCGSGGFGNGDGIMDELNIQWVAINLGLGTKYPPYPSPCNNWARGNPGVPVLADYWGGVNVPISTKWEDLIYVWGDYSATSTYPVVMRLSGNSYDASAGINTDAIFSTAQVAAFDNKLDDGDSTTGLVVVRKETAAWAICYKSVSGKNYYNTSSNISQCAMSFLIRYPQE